MLTMTGNLPNVKPPQRRSGQDIAYRSIGTMQDGGDNKLSMQGTSESMAELTRIDVLLQVRVG